MMMMSLCRTLQKSSSSFLNCRHFSSMSTAAALRQYEHEKHLYSTVKSLLGNSELDNALEYVRSPVVERSRMATKAAIFELIIPDLYQADRNRDVLKLVIRTDFEGCKLYHNLDCLCLIRSARVLWSLWMKHTSVGKEKERSKTLRVLSQTFFLTPSSSEEEMSSSHQRRSRPRINISMRAIYTPR